MTTEGGSPEHDVIVQQMNCSWFVKHLLYACKKKFGSGSVERNEKLSNEPTAIAIWLDG